ncbi:stage II sporulation protein E [Hazenella coriacea]|uniref:Stage II sporulation protein E n=1 Tax=Hazenella coriacea TaxID=1179467 RepID=A0A4R3L3Q1_9BACL|nr:stage II sporulation protein E [Hazenella coriacea]TCS94283.1 stage II sporulation protein E [Hazenella coriacea]
MQETVQKGKWLGWMKKKQPTWNTIRQRRWFDQMIYKWNLPVIGMGFLLGRATILDSVSPFAIAYLAVIFHLARKQWLAVMGSLILGAVTVNTQHAIHIAVALICVLFMQKVFQWMGKGQISYAPFVVGLSSGVAHLLRISDYQTFDWYQGLLIGVDLILSFILTFIFVHSLPIFTVRKKRISLRHEEIVCLVILVGSVLTGAMGMTVGDLSVAHVLSRYFILVLALVGGGLLGSSMGVVTGLILSLSNPEAILQISLLAFAGLLAGLFKEGRRIGVSIGFMLGSVILTLYDGGTSAVWMSSKESLIAIAFFMITPGLLFQMIERYIPGTLENQNAQQEYIKRLRDVTAAKVEQFRELFQELSFSFREDPGKHRQEDEDQVEQILSQVISQSCQGCRKYEACWEQNVMKTYQGMTDLMALVETDGKSQPVSAPPLWENYCVRPNQVIESIQEQYLDLEQHIFWREKMKESRRLVSDQLAGMAEVMSKLAGEIRHETQVLSAQEEQIHESLEELGLSITRVDIINLEEGKVEIEVVMPHRDGLDECRKLVAPLLTEILGEPIQVFRKVVTDGSPSATITLGSAQRFELKTGAATAAKGGGFVSGDSYCYMNLGTGKYAVALSDGMGNGKRAQDESNAALKLLRRLLQSGMSEDRTVDTVNSILSLRTADEMFATVDLAMVDLNTAHGRFMKVGSTPGFIKRGNQVHMVSAANPPIGILKEIDIDPIEMQLEPGDLVIMMTDGIYDAPRHTQNKDAFIKRMITEIDTKDPQDFADLLLEKVVRHREGNIGDDMTVVVSKVERHAPEWSTIRLPGVHRIERSQPAI